MYIHNYNCLYEQIIFLLKKERKLLSNGKKHQTKSKLQPPPATTLQSYYNTRSSPLISLLYLGTYLLVRPVYFCLRIIVCSLFSLAYNYGLFKKISKNSMEYSCNFGWQSIPPSPSKRVIFRVVVELSVKPWSIKSNFCNSQPSESIRHWRRFNRPP